MNNFSYEINDLPLNPSDEFYQDPQQFYARLPKEAIFYSNNFRRYVVTQYALAREILQNKSFGAQSTETFGDTPLTRLTRDWLVMLNPPQHTDLRKGLVAYFSYRHLHEHEGVIRGVAQQLIQKILDKKGQVDFLQEFALALPVYVTMALMDLAANHQDQLYEWIKILNQAANCMFTRRPVPDVSTTIQQVKDYFQHEILMRRQNPKKDLLTDVAMSLSPRFSEEIIVANIILMFIGGYDTTSNAINNSLYLLLTHPEQLQLLLKQRELLPQAIHELLRYEPPLTTFGRLALEDITLDVHDFKKGDNVLLLLGMINHDPKKFEHPHTINIYRPLNQNLVFGHGMHLCLGKNLVELETKIALEELLFGKLQIKLKEPLPKWRPNFGIRGLTHLYLEI